MRPASVRIFHFLHSRRTQEIGNGTAAAIRAGADGHALASAAQPPARVGGRAGRVARHEFAGLELRLDAKQRSRGARAPAPFPPHYPPAPPPPPPPNHPPRAAFAAG